MLASPALQDPRHLQENWSLWDSPKERKALRENQGFRVSQEQVALQDSQDLELLVKKEKRESLVCQDLGVPWV